MQGIQRQELLILAKTYPSPSTKYRETTCVAALTRQGELRRIFPVPFRLLEGDRQFRKWEWIQAKVYKADKDHRPESYRIDTDSIVRSGNFIEVKKGDWTERLRWIKPHVINGFSELESRRQKSGQTLGFIRPNSLLELQIKKVRESDWTDDDKQKLQQDGLFDTADVKARNPLRKLPFDFHYRYLIDSANGEQECVHKLTDWEAGALYWNCVRDHGANWEIKFRERYEEDFKRKDLLFLMGTIHRFPDQWLIVGVVYPPKPPPKPAEQQLGLQWDR